MSEIRWRAFRRMSWVWRGWERMYLWLFPNTRIREGSLFAVRRHGAWLELHLESPALNRLRRETGYSAFKAVREMRADLAALAARMRNGEFRGVAGIRARSLMGEAGAVLGFHTRVAPRSLANAFLQYFQVGIDAIYHPLGLRERAKRRWPVEIWMTTVELLERYPSKSDSSTVAR